MPKAIKKKPEKRLKSEDNVRDLFQDTKEYVSEKQKVLLPALIGVVVVILAAVGFSIYRSNAHSRAEALEYEGYKIYYNLYRKQPLAQSDQYQKALEKFSKASEIRKSPFALFYAANCYSAMGNLDDALQALKELKKLFPGDEHFVTLSSYKMGDIFLKKGDKEAALKELDAITQAKASSFKDLALIGSARILEGMGKKDEAMKKYEELTKNFPTSPYLEEAKTKLGVKKD